MPLSLVKSQNKTLVWANFSADSTITRRDEILKINGKGINSIMDKMASYMITDGDISAVKRYKAINNFASNYFWFIDQPDSFLIEYRSYADGKVKQIEIPAINRNEMIEWRNQRYGKAEIKERSISDVYEFNIEGKVATLKLKTFNRQLKDQFKIKTKKLYNEIFTSLKESNVQHLIIDVRSNTGGRREYAWDLLPYLMKSSRQGIIYKDVSWKGKESKNKYPKQHKLHFTGQIYVLTNSATFSNGSVVTMYAKEYGNAVVIGKETASRYSGFAAGSRQTVYLPHTKLRIGIPRYLLIRNASELTHNVKNRGVIPDYYIDYDIDDRIMKKDLEMDKAMELINENN